MTPRPAPARRHSLCGTARRLAAEENATRHGYRHACRQAGIWACKKTFSCSRRMSARR
jgi:hypothetical protein